MCATGPSMFHIHRPAFRVKRGPFCEACGVRWPCLFAAELAQRAAAERKLAKKAELPLWFLEEPPQKGSK
jgi:hypothetical protein